MLDRVVHIGMIRLFRVVIFVINDGRFELIALRFLVTEINKFAAFGV